MKSIIFCLVAIMLFCGLHAAAQPPIQWQKCYGGTNMDNGRKVVQTADGGYIACGNSISIDGEITDPKGNDDYWVIKVAANGSLEWQRSYGGSGTDFATSIVQLTDGSYVVAGYSNSHDSEVSGNHGYEDYWVLNISSTGSIIWQKSFGGSSVDDAFAMVATNDGGIVVGGATNSYNGDVTGYMGNADYWLVKLSSSGALMWQRDFGGSQSEVLFAVSQTSDNGYIVTGYSNSNDHDVSGNHGDFDMWVVKLDADGLVQWQRSLGGSALDQGRDIRQVADGGYIMVGFTLSTDGDVTGNHGDADLWVVKLSDTGAIDWQKCYGGASYDNGMAVCEALGGGYLVAGVTQSDGWVIHIDDTGALLWERLLGGANEDYFSSLVQTADSGIVVLGYAGSDDGDVSGNHGYWDFWMVRLAYNSVSSPQVQAPAGDKSVVLYPNPAKDKLHIITATTPRQILIRDVTGRLVYSRHTEGGSKDIDISALHPGLYFLQADDNQPQQFVKQ